MVTANWIGGIKSPLKRLVLLMAANVHSGYNELPWKRWITNERTNHNAWRLRSLLFIQFQTRNLHWCPIGGISSYEMWCYVVVYVVCYEKWLLPVVNVILDCSQCLPVCSYGLFQSITSLSPTRLVQCQRYALYWSWWWLFLLNAVSERSTSALCRVKMYLWSQCSSYGSTTCYFCTPTCRELMH